MENQKTSLIYGAYGAFLGIVFYFMLLLSGNSPWSPSSWMGAWIPGVTAFFTIKKYLSFKTESFISFSEIFRIAIIAIIAQAAIFEVLVLFSNALIDTGALEMYHTELAEQAEQISDVFGEELTEKMMLEIKKTTLMSLAFGDFIYKIIGGVIVSLILAATLKKNKSLPIN
jgi:putative flippase GtrA